MNKNVSEFLKYYIDKENKLEYAILLDGEWGAGKTYFIKSFMVEQGRKNFIYISLYGVSKFSEIEDQIFKELHPTLASKPFMLGAKIVKGALKMGATIDLGGVKEGDNSINANLDSSGISIKNFLNMETDRILIFDDLERSEIQVNKVLGYINHLVEHQNQKVILIGHEKKIQTSCDETKRVGIYNEIKEKLIGRTFVIQGDQNEAFCCFLVELNDDEVSKVLEKNKDLIFHTYKIISYKNLRSLRHALFEFKRLFGILPQKVRRNDSYISELIKHLMILIFEMRKGILTDDDLELLPTLSVYYSPRLDNEDKKKKEDWNCKLEEFFRKYEDLDFHKLVPSNNCWHQFFKQGVIDENELNESILNSIFFRDENTDDWVKLWYFRNLQNNEDFYLAYNNVVKKFNGLEYTHPGVIKHVAGLLLSLGENKIVSDEEKWDKTKIISKITDIFDKNKVEIIVEDYDYHGAYAGLGYTNVETSDFKEISGLVENLLEREKVKKYPEYAQKILEYMRSDFGQFRKFLSSEFSDKLRLYDKPILKYIDPSVFVQSYIDCSSDKKNMIEYGIRERYPSASHYKELLLELPWLEQVQQNLINQENKKSCLEKYLLKEFREYYIEKSIDILKAIKLNKV